MKVYILSVCEYRESDTPIRAYLDKFAADQVADDLKARLKLKFPMLKADLKDDEKEIQSILDKCGANDLWQMDDFVVSELELIQ